MYYPAEAHAVVLTSGQYREIVPDRKIEDLLIPFCADATDILNGTEVVFSEVIEEGEEAATSFS